MSYINPCLVRWAISRRKLGSAQDLWCTFNGTQVSALAAYPRGRWSASMRECVERACELFLERELHRQGGRYGPWYRLHDPVHYYYDVLVGLELVIALGRGSDPRIGFGLKLLRSKRRRDGRWNLEALHPDVEGSLAQWYERHPREAPLPFALESPGEPSRMVTLRALKVLAGVDGGRAVLPEGRERRGDAPGPRARASGGEGRSVKNPRRNGGPS